MSKIQNFVIVNRLLADLSSVDRAAVVRCCVPVDLEFGTVLCEPEQIFRDVYFPLSALISLVATVAPRARRNHCAVHAQV